MDHDHDFDQGYNMDEYDDPLELSNEGDNATTEPDVGMIDDEEYRFVPADQLAIEQVEDLLNVSIDQVEENIDIITDSNMDPEGSPEQDRISNIVTAKCKFKK